MNLLSLCDMPLHLCNSPSSGVCFSRYEYCRSDLPRGVFAWYILFHLFTFNSRTSLYLNWVSCRRHIIASCFYSPSNWSFSCFFLIHLYYKSTPSVFVFYFFICACFPFFLIFFLPLGWLHFIRENLTPTGTNSRQWDLLCPGKTVHYSQRITQMNLSNICVVPQLRVQWMMLGSQLHGPHPAALHCGRETHVQPFYGTR